MCLAFGRDACHRSVMSGWLKYLKKMRGVLSRRGREREDIEDLMQDALVRLLEYCKNGAEVREPEAVLVRTVQRLAMNHDRDAHSELYTDQPLEKLVLIDPGPTPEEVLSGDQCLDGLRKTLDAVSSRLERCSSCIVCTDSATRRSRGRWTCPLAPWRSTLRGR